MSTAFRLFSSVFLWNFGLGVSHIVVPLCASHLGFSLVVIGSLFALPVLLQFALGLLSGAATDRWGGRATLLLACASPLIGGLIFSVADSLMMMMLGQIAISVGRGVFWPASQSIASVLEGERSVQMGRLNASVSVGQITGTAGAGILLAATDFSTVFLTFTGLNLLALFICLMLPDSQKHSEPQQGGMFASFMPLLKTRRIYYALICAYVCAQPVSLGQSFLPLLFEHAGFSPDEIGPILSLRAVGATFAALMLARVIGSGRGPILAALGACTIGIGLIVTAQIEGPQVVIVAMSFIGVAAGLLMLFYQLLVTEISHGGNRGTALAIAGSGWSLSHLSAPFIVGSIAESVGLEQAFIYWGGFLVVLGLLMVPLNHWTRQPVNSDEVVAG
ncbi:MAG: MFS transporter [Immundisolibacteraceae bacterium]|nr:MFS transporter [Immundisolibacteraceae bacterium]